MTHYLTLFVTSALGALVGFLLGWMRGRRDLATDLDDELGEIATRIEAIPTHCAECGAGFKARCPNGHPSPRPRKAGGGA